MITQNRNADYSRAGSGASLKWAATRQLLVLAGAITAVWRARLLLAVGRSARLTVDDDANFVEQIRPTGFGPVTHNADVGQSCPLENIKP